MICRLIGHRYWFRYHPGGAKWPRSHCSRCGKVNR